MTEKKARTAKPFITVAKVEQETIEVRIKKSSVDSLDAYAEFAGCSRGEVIDALAETLAKKDKGFKDYLANKQG